MDAKLWSEFIEKNAIRMGSVDDVDDRRQSGWLAAIEAESQGMAPDKVAWAIRNAMAHQVSREVQFSDLAIENEEGDEDDFDVEDTSPSLEMVVLELHGKARVTENSLYDGMMEAIAASDSEMAFAYSEAISLLYAENSPGEGDLENPEPMTVFEVPAPEGGHGPYELYAEEAREQLAINSDVLSDEAMARNATRMGFEMVNPELAIREAGTLFYTGEWRVSYHGTLSNSPSWMDTSTYERLPIEDLPSGTFGAVRAAWGMPEFPKVLKGILAQARVLEEHEKAWLLRYLGSHLENSGLVEDRSEFYSQAIPILGLERDWEGVWVQGLDVGEDQVDPTDGGLGHISNILYPQDWMGWDTDPVPDISWPEGNLETLLESIKSVGSKPWETAIYLRGLVKATSAGASWSEARSAGWDAWRKVRQTREANAIYHRTVRDGKSVEAASKAASAVDKVTKLTAGLIVKLHPTGITVDGNGRIEEWAWEKAEVCASKLWVERGKEASFVAAASKIEAAQNFVQAFREGLEYRKQLAR